MSNKNWDFDTKAIHSGQDYEQWKNLEIVTPIVTSNTFYQNDPTKMNGHYYSRVSNPTRDALQTCLATLDNGKHGLVFPSGCAAVTALLHLVKAGDHIISCNEQYGGTRLLLLDYVKIQGIELDFVDTADLDWVENTIKPNTKLIWTETPSNPCYKITDIQALAQLAHSKSRDIVVAVDNTFLTPYFQRPLELGADVSMYSLTKYMNGHNDVLGGALIVKDDKIYDQLRVVQTKYGSVLSPFDCYLVNRSLKTLSLRMQKHSDNGLAIARYLQSHPNVLKVIYPGFPTHPNYEVSQRQSSGTCGMVTFHVKGSQNDAKRFINNLKVFQSSGSLGTPGSFVVIPACVSHYSMPRDEREKLEIFDSTIRVSVGLENADDLIHDMDQAFRKTFA